MSLLNKLMELTRLNEEDDDDYFLDDDDYEDEKPAKRSVFSRSSRNEDEDDEDEPAARPRFMGANRSSGKVVPMRRSMEVTMIKPTSMEDSKEICDYLLSGKAVVLNMEGIHTEVAQRIIDFTSGATYSMRGNLQKISSYIFIATPDSVELSGDFQDLLSGGSLGAGGLNIHL